MATQESTTPSLDTTTQTRETALQHANDDLSQRCGELVVARAFAQGVRERLADAMEKVPDLWHNGEGIKCVETYGMIARLREMTADFPRIEKQLLEAFESAQAEYNRLSTMAKGESGN